MRNINPLDSFIQCVWINSNGDNRSDNYHVNALELVVCHNADDYDQDPMLFDD
jgi:hypothetical protein